MYTYIDIYTYRIYDKTFVIKYSILNLKTILAI